MAAQMNIGVPFDYEPIKVNRFVADFDMALGIESWKIQEFSGPELKINKVTIDHLNAKSYVIGKGEWSEVTIKLLSIIGPSTASQVMEWARLHHESVTGRQGYAMGYQKDIILTALDPTGLPVQKWTLEKCQIVSVKFDDFKMSGDEVSMITITVQPRHCIQNY